MIAQLLSNYALTCGVALLFVGGRIWSFLDRRAYSFGSGKLLVLVGFWALQTETGLVYSLLPPPEVIVLGAIQSMVALLAILVVAGLLVMGSSSREIGRSTLGANIALCAIVANPLADTVLLLLRSTAQG